MSLLDEFRRVTKREPCPVCEHPDWCLVSKDGDGSPVSAICKRIESGRRWGEAGHLHLLRESEHQRGCRPRRRTIKIPVARAEFPALAERLQAALTDREADDLAGELGVKADSLRLLGLGWSGTEWTFPMHDAVGVICGIQKRPFRGKKWSVKGSRMGLFLPADLDPGEQLFVLEGASDTAAFLDLGFAAIGRPSCSTGVKLITRYVREHQVRTVVVVADADGPGRRGAQRLVPQLHAMCRSVRLIEPGGSANDAREWITSGASRAEVLAVVDAAEPASWKVSVSQRKRT